MRRPEFYDRPACYVGQHDRFHTNGCQYHSRINWPAVILIWLSVGWSALAVIGLTTVWGWLFG